MSLRDQPESWAITSHEVLATGRVQTFVQDLVVVPTGGQMMRQYTLHPGAVAIIAQDDRNRIALVHQYRHPVAMRLVEPPAGLLDVAGEPYLEAAKRELAEEAQLAADDWSVLIDIFTSPGGQAESLRIFLARGLHPAVRPAGFVVEDEETDMGLFWLDLDEAVELVYTGQVSSPAMVAGTLALAHAVATGRVNHLRAPDAAWPARDAKLARDQELNRLG